MEIRKAIKELLVEYEGQLKLRLNNNPNHYQSGQIRILEWVIGDLKNALGIKSCLCDTCKHYHPGGFKFDMAGCEAAINTDSFYCQGCDENGNCQGCEKYESIDYIEYTDELKKLIERQISKKVIKIEGFSSQACPICKSNVNGKYCSECGQKLIY